MLTDAEILVLKLAFERRLINASMLANCVTLYKASGGTRRLGDIICREGGVNPSEASRIGELANKARQSRGSIIVSRSQMEDELLKKLLQHNRILDDATLKRVQLEQQTLERNGRFSSLGEILASRNLISQINLRKSMKQGLDRLATCVGCYRHFVTPQVLPQKEYPCRHCGQTIYVGELPERAYQAMSSHSHSLQNPQGNGATGTMGPRDTGYIRKQAGPGAAAQPKAAAAPEKDPNRVFMTGRFEAIQLPKPQPKSTPPINPNYQGKNTVDEELTVALSDLNKGKEAKKASKGAKFGDFEILDELARGGFGVVYKAMLNDKVVALKVLIGGEEADKQAIRRFNKEAELCKKLRHPGIVALVASGKIQDFPFIAMEFVSGDTIEQRINDGSMDPKISAKFVKSIAEAVHHAHRVGIIHRDLKPANLILCDDTGMPKIIDFGVAKNVDDEMRYTQSGVAVGTPYYMSPEQVKGEGDLVGPRTDVYALGVILYEMLTGTVPFKGENPMELYHNIASEEVILPSQHQARIPKDLETICLVAMAKEIEDRYDSAQAMAKDLGRFLSGRPVEARRPSGSIFFNPIFLIVASLLIAVSIIVGVALLKNS